MAVKISKKLRETINKSRGHLATSTKEGKPNVVPIGFIEAIDDHKLLIVDILLDKTRRNLAENPQVAIAVEALEEFKAYQLKGRATIFTNGEIFERAFQVVKRREERRKMRYIKEGIEEPEWLYEIHQTKPKAAILIEVEEVYSTISGQVE